MAQYSEGRYLDIISDADLSAVSNTIQTNLFRIVSLTTSASNGTGRTVALTTSATDANVLGVLNNAPKAGEVASVCLRNNTGTFKVVVSANSVGVSVNDALTASSDSGAVTTTTTSNHLIGYALEAGVAGQVIAYRPTDKKYGN